MNIHLIKFVKIIAMTSLWYNHDEINDGYKNNKSLILSLERKYITYGGHCCQQYNKIKCMQHVKIIFLFLHDK